jgi:hypothetical protein
VTRDFDLDSPLPRNADADERGEPGEPGRPSPANPAETPPEEILRLVRERSEARRGHSWTRADALKAQIEAAGWRVTDRGARSSVRLAAPATLEVAGEIRYGSAADVPSALHEPATAPWTVAVYASEEPERVSRLLEAVRAHAPAGTQIVVVANDPSEAQVAALGHSPETGARAGMPAGSPAVEVLRTSVRLGYAAALNVALRRARGSLVLLADGSAIPTGDAFEPLTVALRDEDVAAAGGFGLLSEAGGRLTPSALVETSEPGDVVALRSGWLAFRRDDYPHLGPLDERFVTPAWLDVWWTLRLRAGEVDTPDAATQDHDGEIYGVEDVEAVTRPESAGPAELEGQARTPGEPPAPRRAVCLDLALEGLDYRWPPERTRLNRRNMYRLLDDFGWRTDLIGSDPRLADGADRD